MGATPADVTSTSSDEVGESTVKEESVRAGVEYLKTVVCLSVRSKEASTKGQSLRWPPLSKDTPEISSSRYNVPGSKWLVSMCFRLFALQF